MSLEIKAEYLNTVVAFGGSGIPLRMRTQTDLVNLALLAHSSKDPMITRFFKTLPSESQLKNMKMAEVEKAVNDK